MADWASLTTMASTPEAMATDVNSCLPRLPWQQQHALERAQGVSLYEMPPSSTASLTTMQPWYPLVDQFPLLPAQAAADDSLAPSPGMPRESLGSYLPSGFTGGLGDPASLNAANCAFPTSFSSASRNATRPSAATSLSLSAPAIADHNLNLNLNFGFNFAAARTTHALALQNSFFPPIDTPLDQFHRRTHEPLSPTQFGALEQHDPTATSESFPPLAPLSHPPHPVTATTLVNAISTLAQPLQLPQDFSNIDWATKRSIESTGQTEEPNEVPYDNSNSGGGGGCIGSGNEITCGGSLQTHDMPATSSRKRTRAASYVDDATGPSSSSNKRKSTTAGRQTTNAPRASSRVIVEEWPEIPDSDDLFGSDPFGDVEDELKMFDLTKDDIRPGELVVPGKPKQKEEEDNRIRLAKFECIICMDNASNLTVTHCGHMFCAQCLHQAMHAEVTKKICPMCRQKLDVRPKNGGAMSKNAKTFFHLELKLMPSKRQGKQRAQ